MILMMLAFTCVFWGTAHLTWSRAFEISASSLTTLGFAEPTGTGRIGLAFVEATIGLGLVALLISYLPTIYSAYNGREKGTNRLRPVAGSPPSPQEFLRSLQRLGSLESPEIWSNAADWMLDLEQTHTAFPILTYFPGSDSEQSWVATVGAVLDASALVVAASEIDMGDVFADAQRGPLTVLVYGLPLIVRVASAVYIPATPADAAPGVVGAREPARATDEHQPGRVRHRAGGLDGDPRRRSGPRGGGVAPVRLDPLRLRPRSAGARRGHAGVTRTVDHRPSGRGGQPSLPSPAPAARRLDYRWLKPPDSSLVIDTVTGWRSKWAMDCVMSSSSNPARSRLTPWRTRMRWTEMSATDPVNG